VSPVEGEEMRLAEQSAEADLPPKALTTCDSGATC
jgi:hypothetical protein